MSWLLTAAATTFPVLSWPMIPSWLPPNWGITRNVQQSQMVHGHDVTHERGRGGEAHDLVVQIGEDFTGESSSVTIWPEMSLCPDGR